MAWAPDGRVWIGDMGGDASRGLWAAPNIDTAPQQLPMADYAVQCLAYRPETDTLYACQHFWLGEVGADTGAFSTRLSFATVGELVTCSGQDIAHSCEQQLCGAYCGVSHFAAAPVCGAYDNPGCGVPVARAEGAAWADQQPTGADAADSGSAGASGAYPVGMAGAPRAGIGAETPAPATKALSGCACVVRPLGTGHPSSAGLAWFALLVLSRWRRRSRCG
jgi:hypothetical protein